MVCNSLEVLDIKNLITVQINITEEVKDNIIIMEIITTIDIIIVNHKEIEIM